MASTAVAQIATRTHCTEGHALASQVAEAGRCADCKRWVFSNEKVMSCACCSSYYCSACAPSAGTDDKLWEDVLSTLGSALRDVERIKDTVSVEISNVSVDLERFRSAFNCQEVGSETLSAEQIVVEHAFEQAKSVMSCGAPTDLGDQEEVVDHRRTPQSDDEEVPRSGGYGAVGGDHVPQTPHEEPASEEPLAQAPTDLLDLASSSPVEVTAAGAGSPMGLMSLSPVQAAAAEPMIIASAPEKAPTDLLDLSLHDEPDEVVPAVVPAKASMDLMDLQELPLPMYVEAPKAVAPDLLDLAFEPEALSPAKPEIAAMPSNQHTNLQDIVDVKVEPAPSPAVHDLADLLDFGEQPKAQAA